MSEAELSVAEFNRFRELIYKEFGISLSDQKRTLVKARLRKWLHEFNLGSYDELYTRLTGRNNHEELILLANAITTNVTSFFREEKQWIYLREHLQSHIDHETKKIRIWSSACSSGQEPYTILIFLIEHLTNFKSWDVKILATDLSEDILVKAMEGLYTQKELEGMPRPMLAQYFDAVEVSNKPMYQIKEALKKYVVFRQFNLITGNYSMFNPNFDFIFCRNVMIYFDKPTQLVLVDKLLGLLRPKGLFFIGHSESLGDNHKKHQIKLVSPAVYQTKAK